MGNVWAGLVGKKKFIVPGLFSLFLALNSSMGWGVSEEDIQKMFILILSALGLDGAEGIAASFNKEKKG